MPLKTYDLSSNPLLQSAIRQLVNSGVISDLPAFIEEVERLVLKSVYYQAMEEKYADLLEEIHELRNTKATNT